MSSIPVQLDYHPLFSSPDADIVFRSSEGTHYRMHSFVLRTTSGFFQPMLSLVGGSGSSPDSSSEASPIGLGENDDVLKRLFAMISGMEVPQWDSLDKLEHVLHAAEKYDMPGPISTIRSAITAPRFMEDPLRVYAIAARYQWEEALQPAAEGCFAIAIHHQQYIPILKRIPSDDLLRLIDLRRERRDAFLHAIDHEVQFTSGNNADKCSCSRSTDHRGWYALKLAVYMEMDKKPIVRNLDDQNWEVANKCWSYRCQCAKVVYDQVETMKRIRPCIERLPTKLRPRI
ncbi:hypothetical protein DEU56DRAFT_740536 [Suillus clintonianus]|uniref:uncharacterized protein n=1 Tax=Suillus clintonianus TaxID=1904413 RepID=UPI001B86AA7C|nr:uncharacterized protein DEU56DRAFT_740536 [Suillus clintonianus]KAG2130701.1 hypothetical protein DEU56DRAFT_740536 [Suillus clintonianus]